MQRRGEDKNGSLSEEESLEKGIKKIMKVSHMVVFGCLHSLLASISVFSPVLLNLGGEKVLTALLHELYFEQFSQFEHLKRLYTSPGSLLEIC